MAKAALPEIGLKIAIDKASMGIPTFGKKDKKNSKIPLLTKIFIAKTIATTEGTRLNATPTPSLAPTKNSS